MGNKVKNDSRVILEAEIPVIGGSHLPYKTHKKVHAYPPTSITGVLPKPLGKVKAESWDQPALRGASEWILDHSVQDSEMRCLYREGKALLPHECTSDHNAAIFHIDEHMRSLPDLTTALLNPSGVPHNLHTEGAYVNVNDVNVWYWINLVKPKYCGADTNNALQTIFSTTGQWSSIATGQWKKNNSWISTHSPTG
ncbi:hypothetical protein M422DRAFT_251977 [Sphaerobolus stellatus SS14]|uniref:Unplaced genomic scaffold SPHSTscaffold_41, whole genome shotgun sequence n=1 Tax=Sphaerobolus stellatus (strain SS14) TaxID=990650 RepID=A0A0C9VQQ9_SPHS4|nr:hypothetical protein M422DRAFT_251977 [Sphaerobolus stellatus SS14]